MADGTGGGGSAAPPDILWSYPGQVGTDQDSNMYYKARKVTAFVAFDVNARVAPSGSAVIIDWFVNNVVVPGARMTLAIGATYVEVLFAQTLQINDEIRPVIFQIGSATPGQTMIIRARGS